MPRCVAIVTKHRLVQYFFDWMSVAMAAIFNVTSIFDKLKISTMSVKSLKYIRSVECTGFDI